MRIGGEFKKSIKTKVVLKVSVLIAFILTIAFSIVVYISITNLQEKTSLELETSSKNLAHDIEQKLEYLIENTKLLANNELIVNAFIDKEKRDSYLLPLINNFKKDTYLNRLSIVDFDGRGIFQTDKSTPKFQDSQELRLALSLAQTITYFNTAQNEIVFIVPIKYYDTTQGAIIATYNMQEIIQRYNELPFYIYTKFFKNALEYYSINYDPNKSYYAYQLLDNKENILLHELGMTLEIGIQDKIYTKPIQKMILLLSFFALLLLALGVWLSYSVATTITNPILALYAKVNRRSFEEHYEPLGTEDELEVLASSFYEKEKELEQLNKNLQLKIDEATKELQISELLKKNILATIGDLIWLKDTEGVYIACNPEFERFFGAKESEIVGKTDYDFVDKELADSFRYYDKQAMESSVPSVNEEWLVYASDGHKALFEATKQQFKDDEGNLLGILGISHDITERFHLLEELEAQRNRFSLAIEGAQDALWDWNLQTNTIMLSERFEQMLGYNIGDLPKTVDAWFGLLHPDDKEKTDRIVQEYLASKGQKNYEATFRLEAKDGSWRWMLGRGKALFDQNGNATRFVGFNTDITEQKKYQDKLDHTAKHDVLTHLPNRFLLSELLLHTMRNVKRKNQQLALLFIDLDGFKEINDTYGHDAGDEVLIIIAQRMNEIVRESDIVSRLGGDEFVIVISELKNSGEIIPILQRLLSDLSLSINYKENSMHVSASIGISFYPQLEDIGTESLLRQADQAMYQAKLAGKNQYKFFNIEESQELKEQQQDISHVREAIKKDELVLFYQPKVDMRNNSVVGFEALLRWNHPQRGLLYPDSFLPLIERESSFMIELGHWVFENAFSQLETWHLAGSNISLSINVSSHEIKQENFATYLEKLLMKFPGIKPNTLEIEILETSALDDFELTSNVLSACQELGVSIAIDDFGTGYASLHYLKKLPMNALKIDKSFVLDLLTQSQNLSIVEASIGLAQAFNSKVVAEGVETEEHGKVLLQLGCEIAQGFVISKAMPAENVIEWMRSWKGFESWKVTKPINIENRAILHAAIEHRNWIESIEVYLQNKNLRRPKLAAKECHLGRWLLAGASTEKRNNPVFKELSEIHSELHIFAEEVLLGAHDNNSEDIKKIEQLREEILIKLELLMMQD